MCGLAAVDGASSAATGLKVPPPRMWHGEDHPGSPAPHNATDVPTASLLPERQSSRTPNLGTWGTVVHLFKGNIGPGILALPLHFSQVGPMAGLFVTVAVVLQGIYGMVLLLRVQRAATGLAHDGAFAADRLQGTTLSFPLAFEDVGMVVLGAHRASAPPLMPYLAAPREPSPSATGRGGRLCVQVALASLQLGVCSVFIAFCATNLTAVVALNNTVAVFIVWCLVSLLALLPTLRSLVPLSVFGAPCGRALSASHPASRPAAPSRFPPKRAAVSRRISARSTTPHRAPTPCTEWHEAARDGTRWHSTACTAQHSTAQHSTAQHRTAQHSTAQHSTAQHRTTPRTAHRAP